MLCSLMKDNINILTHSVCFGQKVAAAASLSWTCEINEAVDIQANYSKEGIHLISKSYD